jgi:hypothetical protein
MLSAFKCCGHRILCVNDFNSEDDIWHHSKDDGGTESLARFAAGHAVRPEWVQLDVASGPGQRLRAAIPGQNRPAGQYLDGWTRDFITVLAG